MASKVSIINIDRLEQVRGRGAVLVSLASRSNSAASDLVLSRRAVARHLSPLGVERHLSWVPTSRRIPDLSAAPLAQVPVDLL